MGKRPPKGAKKGSITQMGLPEGPFLLVYFSDRVHSFGSHDIALDAASLLLSIVAAFRRSLEALKQRQQTDNDLPSTKGMASQVLNKICINSTPVSYISTPHAMSTASPSSLGKGSERVQ